MGKKVRKAEDFLKVFNKVFVEPEVVSTLNTKYEVCINEQIVENGRIINKPIIKTIDMAEEMKPYKVSDFYLENLIASGSVDGLKDVTNEFGSLGMDGLDGISNQLAGIEVPEAE